MKEKTKQKWETFRDVCLGVSLDIFELIILLILPAVFYVAWFYSGIPKEVLLFWVIIYFWVKLNPKVRRKLGLGDL